MNRVSNTENLALARIKDDRPEWMREMIAAEQPGMTLAERSAAANVHQRPLIHGAAEDARAHDNYPPRRGSGWVTAPALGPGPHVAHCDRIAEAAAEEDRRLRVREWLDRK
jgi:hypothetical protein